MELLHYKTQSQTILLHTSFKLRFNGRIITFPPMKFKPFQRNPFGGFIYLPSHKTMWGFVSSLGLGMPLEFCLVNSHVARKPNMVKMVKTERVPRVSRVRERVWFQLWECCGFSSPCHFQVIYRACDCCASASTGRYLQQEPLVADDCGRVPVDDLGERQLPAVTQHHWYTCSLRHTHTESEAWNHCYLPNLGWFTGYWSSSLQRQYAALFIESCDNWTS